MKRGPAVFVGNDVVDVQDPRTVGKAADRRFVGRVLDEAGRDALGQAEDPDLELWCRWAAKEAAYKAVSKLLGAPPPFAHRAFAVSWHAGLDHAGTHEEPERAGLDVAHLPHLPHLPRLPIRVGTVAYGGSLLPVAVHLRLDRGRPAAVHALVRSGPASPEDSAPSGTDLDVELDLLDRAGAPWAGPLEELRRRFTERERDTVGSRRSAAVRLGARALLALRMRVAEERVEIVCDPGSYGRRPPRVLIDGRPGAADVSLSHDGAWIAWAVWTGARGSGQGRATSG